VCANATNRRIQGCKVDRCNCVLMNELGSCCRELELTLDFLTFTSLVLSLRTVYVKELIFSTRFVNQNYSGTFE